MGTGRTGASAGVAPAGGVGGRPSMGQARGVGGGWGGPQRRRQRQPLAARSSVEEMSARNSPAGISSNRPCVGAEDTGRRRRRCLEKSWGGGADRTHKPRARALHALPGWRSHHWAAVGLPQSGMQQARLQAAWHDGLAASACHGVRGLTRSRAAAAACPAHPSRQHVGHIEVCQRAELAPCIHPPRHQEAAALVPQLGKLKGGWGLRVRARGPLRVHGRVQHGPGAGAAAQSAAPRFGTRGRHASGSWAGRMVSGSPQGCSPEPPSQGRVACAECRGPHLQQHGLVRAVVLRLHQAHRCVVPHNKHRVAEQVALLGEQRRLQGRLKGRGGASGVGWAVRSGRPPSGCTCCLTTRAASARMKHCGGRAASGG